MRERQADAVEEAEAILYLCLIRHRYPYLKFRETKLGTLSWYCVETPTGGLPDHWMLVYLYRHQALLRAYLSPPYEDELSR